MNKKLMKGRDSLISGVCSGLADYFDQDPTLVRIIFVVFSLFAGGGLLIYLICIVVMPEFKSEEMIAREERVRVAKRKGKL